MKKFMMIALLMCTPAYIVLGVSAYGQNCIELQIEYNTAEATAVALWDLWTLKYAELEQAESDQEGLLEQLETETDPVVINSLQIGVGQLEETKTALELTITGVENALDEVTQRLDEIQEDIDMNCSGVEQNDNRPVPDPAFP